MTKNILLAATALTVIGFSGAAFAGTLSGTVGSTTPRAVSSTVSYVVASEKADPTSSAAVTAAFALNNVLTNPITVPANATASYNVTFTVAGGAYVATPAVTAVDAGGLPVGTGATYIQADGSLISIITVDNSGAAAKTIAGFTVVGSVKQVSEVSVAIGSTTSVVSGGTSIAIDNTAPVTIIEYKPLVKGFAAVADTAEAALPTYTNFAGGSSTATLATGYKVEANAGTFHGDFTGSYLTVSGLVASGTVTVTGSAGAQLNKLYPTVSGLGAAAGATDILANFTVPAASGQLTSLTSGPGLWFELDNDDAVVLNDASYQATFKPTYVTGFTSPTAAFPAVASGTVTLEGTNFTAPWFTLTNPTNTATLRLANNGSANTGPVFVSLKANNGTNTPTATRVKVSDGIAAGAFITVNGASLASLFGTNAGNADLQVTVQGDGKVISGKVRVQNIASGATFESSLGTLTN